MEKRGFGKKNVEIHGVKKMERCRWVERWVMQVDEEQ